jgi:hypothetical protein
MLGYRKKSFLRAHELLTRLRSHLDDMDVLRKLQQLLVREIVRAERKGRQIRGDLKAVQGNAGTTSKKASSLKRRLDKVRQVAYVWRCFGDAIAFVYMDKFALKQSFYSIHSTNPKQGAGFLADKQGLAGEVNLVETALEAGVPALLTDITNTIRYGDVCIMGNADPVLIEVKSSKNLDKRGKRQKRELEQLDQLFQTDKAENWRGMGQVRRVAFYSGDEEKLYLNELQSAISAALDRGYCVTQPEPGLYYVVFAPGAPPVSEVLKTLSFKSPWLFFLNTVKNDQAWSPYVPFTLSIRDCDHLWAFIRGEVFIVVSLDFEELVDIVKKAGASAQLDLQNKDYHLRLEIPGLESGAMASSHILARIGLEFVSPRWLIESSIEGLRNGTAEILKESELGHQGTWRAPD